MNQTVQYDRIERKQKQKNILLKSVIYTLLGIWALIVLFTELHSRAIAMNQPGQEVTPGVYMGSP